MAIFSAVSTASEPELVKKTLLMPGGAISTSRLGQFEGLRVAHLERRREVHLGGLVLDRLHDLRPRMAGVHAPQAGHAVEDLAALVVPVVHARGLGQQARRLLELAVGREGHPVGVEILVHGGAPGRERQIVQSSQAHAQCACGLRAGTPGLAAYHAKQLALPRQKMRNAADLPQLDAIDRAILDELQRDARLSNVDLAQRVHLSPSRLPAAREGAGRQRRDRAVRGAAEPARGGPARHQLHHRQPGKHAAGQARGLRAGGEGPRPRSWTASTSPAPTTTWCASPTATPRTWSASTPRCCRGCPAWCARTRCWCCAP